MAAPAEFKTEYYVSKLLFFGVWGVGGRVILCLFTGRLGKRSGKVHNYYQLC